ncbi:Fur family transcriptional regulator [Algisphaera agarilytica]|uniref:Ferric uptake regulation protein n=1 Tax=Algisphaera agarilytica TaxID=1385975 RepID=A0A7X0H390_9BACT|nr:transcriptional repressor [Algisphaera agarilytica]MBB6428456.1 Fur family ferric uptake transcriptional regulator [Algisphaera agarilytica]
MSETPAPNAAASPAVPADDLLITPICAIFRRFLKRQGLKFTTERAQTLDVVLGKERVFEADELLDEMKSAGHRVSRATVYRTLKHLLEAGIIREVLIDSNKAHYELSFGKAPKGHLVCVETQRIVEFPTAELDALMQRICEENGFDPVSHRFVVYGVSPEAQKAEQAEQADSDS